ncbi:MAG: LPS export ABC transporter periplasmic protein LptC [Nitrospirae bacterium]|nr:LPS export ABC transporter periplasmic protein LptC [Nitrospirota bacterium]
MLEWLSMLMRMTSKWKLLLGVIYIFLFIIVVAGFFSGYKDNLERPSVLSTLGDTVQEIDDFYLTRVNGSIVEWEIGAKKASIASGEEEALLQDINITHRTQQVGTITLTAEKGRYNIGTSSFFMEKEDRDVIIRLSRDVTINVGNLMWSDEDRQVRSTGMVHVTGQAFVLDGEGLVANLDSGIYEIRKNIRARIW